ncbi:MAG TPA: SgcJ/EcaC family oxidoreductase [Thermomicrobiales bacterium]|nr:SgcJ/EcaC family oxidoreductase [Thermomicrobiales bacterium]
MHPRTEPIVPAAPADEAAVRVLVQRMNDAWGDADAFAAVFTEDADYVVFDGTHLRGRRAIAEAHRPLFERFLKGSRLVAEPPAVRFLAPDVALVHGMGAILRARQRRPSRGRLSVQTLVAVKGEDGWRLTAFQNTRYRPFAQTLLGKALALAGLAPRGR